MDEEEEIKISSKANESLNNEKSKLKNETSEEIEIEEVENSEEEDKIKSSSKEEKTNTINSFSKSSHIEKEKYLLELKENGLPDIPNNKILSCNIGSLINISLYNGLPITSNISLITDCYQLFPSYDFIDKLIEESLDPKLNLENNYFLEKV